MVEGYFGSMVEGWNGDLGLEMKICVEVKADRIFLSDTIHIVFLLSNIFQMGWFNPQLVSYRV